MEHDGSIQERQSNELTWRLKGRRFERALEHGHGTVDGSSLPGVTLPRAYSYTGFTLHHCAGR